MEVKATRTSISFELDRDHDRDHDVLSIRIPQPLVDQLEACTLRIGGQPVLWLDRFVLQDAVQNGWAEVLRPHFKYLPLSQLHYNVVEIQCSSKRDVFLDAGEAIVVDLGQSVTPSEDGTSLPFTRPRRNGPPQKCTLKILSGIAAASCDDDPAVV